jgi:hypothetical protein
MMANSRLQYEERWDEDKVADVNQARKKVALNFGIEKFFGSHHIFKSFDELEDLYKTLPRPKAIKDWQQDENFGRQRMQGINPVGLKRVTTFPIPNFPVTDEMVKGLLRSGTTLAAEANDERLYCADYSFISPYTRDKWCKSGMTF